MQPISAEIVEQTVVDFAETSEQDAAAIIEEFAAEQPAVLAYLMASGEDELSDDERQVLLYVGTVVWRIFKAAGARLPLVSDTLVIRLEDEHIKALDQLSTAPTAKLRQKAEEIVRRNPQPEVLRYITEAIMEEDDESDAEIRDELRGLLFVYLKTVVDALSQSAR